MAAHTDLIKSQIKTVLEVSKKVAKQSTRRAICEEIRVKLSKIMSLSHQLCQVTKVKFKHCGGEGREYIIIAYNGSVTNLYSS